MTFWENFEIGQFCECIKALNVILKDKGLSPHDYFTHSNNLYVCASHVKRIGAEVEGYTQPESWISLIDNSYLSLKNHSQSATEILIVIIYNAAWWHLVSACDENRSNVEVAYRKIITSLERLGVGTSRAQFRENEHNLLLNTKQLLVASRSPALGIFCSLVSVLVITMLNLSKYSQELVHDFLRKFLEDKHEILALGLTMRSSEGVIIFDLLGSLTTSNDAGQTMHLLEILFFLTSPKQSSIPSISNLTQKSPFQFLAFYVLALRNFQQGDDSKSLGYALQAHTCNQSEALQSRTHLLLGQIYSRLGERHKALDHFSRSLKLNRRRAVVHYFVGYEMGKLGLHDSMIKSYSNMVKACRRREQPMFGNIEQGILKFLHSSEEIRQSSAMYALAVAYGINEMFEESAQIFEELIKDENIAGLIGTAKPNKNCIIEVPHIVQILHEAASMFLLVGKLEATARIAAQAIAAYPDRSQTPSVVTDSHGTKDYQWIKNLVQTEMKMEIEDHTPIRYYENYLDIFEEDLIGLMLLAESYRAEDNEEAAKTLNRALILLSKYIARAQKEKKDEQRDQLALVNALACKASLHLARVFTTRKNFDDVNRMFKRALSCNNGDKDTLYYFASFLADNSRVTDADKLLNTFCDASPVLCLEDVQSLALRYLLRCQTTNRQMSSLIASIKERM